MSDGGSNDGDKRNERGQRPPFGPRTPVSNAAQQEQPRPPKPELPLVDDTEIPATGVEAVRQALRRSALARREAQRVQEEREAQEEAVRQKREAEVARAKKRSDEEQAAQLAQSRVAAEKAELAQKPPPVAVKPVSPAAIGPVTHQSQSVSVDEKTLAAAKLASATAEPSPVVESRLEKVPTADTFPAAPDVTAVPKQAGAAGQNNKVQTAAKPSSPSSRETGSVTPAQPLPTAKQSKSASSPQSKPKSKTKAQVAADEDPLLQERPQHSIVPRSSVAGTALTTVIAIMAFLASLTLGGVSLVRDTAAGWQSDIAREVTIQLRPIEGVDSVAALATTQSIVSGFDGVLSVSVMDDSAMNRLLEPWLGAGLDLGQLPVPRLMTVTVDENNPPDFKLLAARLKDEVVGASLDNHRAWVDRLTTMAQATVAIGLVVLVLMMGATVLMVVFATRGAMAGNAHVIELLHFVGAEQRYIAGQFQRHFLLLGLKGALVGGFAAIAFFLALGWWTSANTADPAAEQVSALFGTFSIGPWGFVGTLFLIFIIALLTALTSRLTVYRHIGALDRSAQEH